MKPNTQGQGIAGRYGGLRDPLASLETSKIVIYPVAYDKTTTYRKGTDKGPASLIEASRNMELYDIETKSEVYLKGICTLPVFAPENQDAMLHTVYSEVRELLRKDKFVVTIGGEHTVSFPAIKAHCAVYPSVSVLHFDAHTDLQDVYEGNRWSHACVMARVAELLHPKIVSVGIRSMSADEKPNLKKITPFYCHELFESDEWMNEVIRQLTDTVYITFDLDVFDSSLMPSTGTPEPGGLFWPTVTKLLKLVAMHKNIIGADVVELCPSICDPAPDFLAAKLIYKILSYKFEL